MSAPASQMCFWHGHEPDLPDDYYACGECLHVWRTPEAFRDDVVTVFAHLGEPPPPNPVPVGRSNPGQAEDIQYACPLCTHDF